MVDYMQACNKAGEMFKARGYIKPLIGALDLPDKWIFFGKRIEGVDFSNSQVAVMKETGEASWYRCCSARNIGESSRGVPIALPV